MYRGILICHKFISIGILETGSTHSTKQWVRVWREASMKEATKRIENQLQTSVGTIYIGRKNIYMSQMNLFSGVGVEMLKMDVWNWVGLEEGGKKKLGDWK